eukprot:GILJ01002542.1.p1 GENE.GILJ01002542.1~~GILJ01002542.1.p1  ORF type:complete len:411 (-),score=90.59 GILJ01002542.1:101-1333(-)
MELFLDNSVPSLVVEVAVAVLRLAERKAVRPYCLSAAAKKHLQIRQLPLLISEDAGKLDEAFTILGYFAKAANQPALLGVTAEEKADVHQWTTAAFAAVTNETLQALHEHLTLKVFIASNHVTIADLAVFASLHSKFESLSQGDRLRWCNVTRWFDHIQHLPGVKGALCKLPLIDICKTKSSAAAAKETKGEAKAKPAKGKGEAKPAAEATPATTKAPQAKEERKKEEKPKAKKEKAPAPPAQPEQPDISRLDIRVGHIIKAWKHPSADKLYCEEIDVGEGKPRQIASGLVPYIPLEKMQNRRCIVLCNLKEKALVGFPSHGMVLCASNADKSVTELLEPPATAAVGERVVFPGLEGPAEAELNPKKNVFGKVQPLFKTTADLVATFDGVPFTTSAGVVKASTIANGTIS